MTVGPLVMAAGVLLLLGVGEDVSYVRDVLPGLTVFGLGLALMVASLTATVLAAAPDEHAGIASGSTTRSPAPARCWPSPRSPSSSVLAASSTPTRSRSTRRTTPR